MVKKLRVLLVFSFALMFLQNTNGQGYLRVKGTKIENDSNKDFILRGMGFGGWMLQEGYMFHLGFLGQQYKIREKITQLIGKKQADIFYDKWLKLHTQKADIDSMAYWGFNSIRLPMHYGLFTLPVKDEPVAGRNTWLPTGFNMVDSLLKWCKQDHIYLILDLHAAPGGEGNDFPIADRHPGEPSLWESKANQDKTVALWRKLAERYKDEPNIGGFDILNETNWGFDNPKDLHGINEQKNVPLRNLFIRITKAIRLVDKKHIIFLEGNGFANNYNGMFPLWDNNLVISFHKYGNFAKKETIQKYLDYRDKYHVPLWLGESGENSNTWYTNNIRVVEDNDIGWSWWQLKKMGVNQPLEIKEPKDYEMFVQYCKDSLQLDSAKGQQILNEFLNNIQIQNNIWHKDVTGAMFRQVYSTVTLPFKPNIISENTTIYAVDYDLGRNGFAYNDMDTCNYRYTPGVHSEGNRGHTYRNDGVDIKKDEKGNPVVFSIENGEWLLYTTNVKESRDYRLSFLTSGSVGVIDVYDNGNLLAKDISVPASQNENDFIQSKAVKVHLNEGVNKIKIFFKKGGFNLKILKLAKG
ncbi:MAG TPA: cellulase family glycosylhydrolase [Hanamia sp.]|nr:cellulase family glycosylhydrolase [Hanamia sp.]